MLLGGIQRVIRAQQALDDAREALDRQYEAQLAASDATGPDRFVQAEMADVAQLNAIRHDLDDLRSTSRRVFRKDTDRQIQALELAGRLVLARLGLSDYDEIDAVTTPHGAEVIDLAYLEYAERELRSAEQDLAALRRGELTAPQPVAAPADIRAIPVDLGVAGIGELEPMEDLEVWAGPPPLPRRILPRRKQPQVPKVTFASLPRLPERDDSPTMWRMLGHASD